MASAVVGALRAVLSADTAAFDKAMAGAEGHVRKLADSMSKQLAPSQSRVNSLVKGFLGSNEIGMAKAYAQAVEQIGGANKLVASDQAKVNRVVQEALQHYKALGVQAPANLKALVAATKGVEGPTRALGTSIDGVIGKARALAGVFGVTLGAAAIGSFIKSTFDAADQVGDLALKMGVSTDAAQRFQFAARQSGAEIEDVSRAIVAMNKNLSEGDKSTVSALNAAGLQFADIRSKKPEDAFRAIADAIAKIPDPMLQSQVAMELFGKAGAELLPMIREESLKAADGINVMSNETVRRLKDAKQAWENFWNGMTIIGADAIVGIMNQWNKMIADLRTGAIFLAGLQAGGVTFALQMAQADVAGRDAAAGQPMRDLQAAMTKSGAMSSHGLTGKFRTREQIEAEERAAKDAASATKRLNDAYRAFERERLTGLTDSQRQAKAFEARFLKDRGLTAAMAWSQSIVSKTTDWNQILTGGKFDIGHAPAPVFEMFGKTGKGLSIEALIRKTGIPFEELMKAVNIPSTFGKQFSSTVAMSPQVILQALTGGGNVGKSIGALFGGELSKGLGTKLGTKLSGSFLGKGLGGAIGGAIPGIASLGMSSVLSSGGGKGMMSNIGSFASAGMMFGPWGAAIGAGIGAIVGAFKKGANNTKKAREEFAKSLGLGSTDDLFKQLQQFGAAGQSLINTGRNVIGKNDTAANDKWMQDVSALFDALPKKVAALSTALERFGGVIPKAAQPLLDSLLKMSNLPPDLRAQLTGLSTGPSWQQAAERASALGIDPAMLGSGFNQSRIASQAFALQHDIELFERFNANVQDFLPGLADELSALMADAIKTGAALPKTLEPYLKQLDAMGLLLDENGNRIDMGALSFQDLEDEALKAIVAVLEDIRDLLSGQLPDAVRKFSKSLSDMGEVGVRMPRLIDDGTTNAFAMSMPDLGAYNAQYAGTFSSGGAMPSPVVGAGMTVVLEQDGRATARWLVPYLPGEVERLRLTT